MVHSLAAGHDNMVCCERRHQGKSTAGPIFPVRHPGVIGSAGHQPWAGADSGAAAAGAGTALFRTGTGRGPCRNDAAAPRRQQTCRRCFRRRTPGPAARCDFADNAGQGADRARSGSFAVSHRRCRRHPCSHRVRYLRSLERAGCTAGLTRCARHRAVRERRAAPRGCGRVRRRDGAAACRRRYRPAASGVFAGHGCWGSSTGHACPARTVVGARVADSTGRLMPAGAATPASRSGPKEQQLRQPPSR